MRHLKPYIARHEPRGRWHGHLKSGAGAVIGMSVVGALAAWTHFPLLLAPLGATAVLLFAQPHSPLAQPANVFGGYIVAAALGLAAALLWPGEWPAATICVGVAIAAMLALRVTHPPAGGVPLLAVAGPLAPTTLFGAIVAGAGCLVAVAVLHHWLPPRVSYPRPIE